MHRSPSQYSATMIGVHEQQYNPARYQTAHAFYLPVCPIFVCATTQLHVHLFYIVVHVFILFLVLIIDREMFMEEAREVSELMNGVHHVRKQGHEQVYYPETIDKLSQLQGLRTQTLRAQHSLSSFPSQTYVSSSTSASSLDARQQVRDFRQTRLKEYEHEMTERMVQERIINYRKKEYFRETGRKAIVNEIISGTAPPQKDALFPLTASHEQILAITGKLKASNPNIIPPEVPRQRKFKADKGWN
jgi:hypothetical protein